MRILVTGGAGYIGTPLCESLAGHGHDVVCWDPGFFGFHFAPDASVRFVRRRVQELDEPSLQQLAPDWILHLSGLSNDPMANFAPDLNWEENTRATEHVGALARARALPLVFASSASVYGYQPDALLKEDSPVQPIGHYSESKAAAEQYLLTNVSKVYCLRQATVMGWSPRMRYDLLTNGMTRTAWTRRAIDVLYGGREARPQVHVQDLVRAYELMLSTPGLEPGVYNVSASNDNVMRLAEVIQEHVSRKLGEPVTLNVTDEEREHRSYNLSSDKLRSATGWAPEYDVSRTVDELCQRLADPNHDAWDVRTLNISWMKLLVEAQDVLARTGPIRSATTADER